MVEVEVEFDYDAELKDELTIRTGDIITEVKQMDGGWWEGTAKNGKRGLFPDNFVKVISSSSGSSSLKKKELDSVVLRKGDNKRKHCKVLFSYQPSHEDELELNINQIIEYTEEVEDGWWKGVTQDGKTGVFPSNFVQVINSKNDDPAPASTNADSEINPVKSVVADKNKKNKEKIGIPQPPTTSSVGKFSGNNSKPPPPADKKPTITTLNSSNDEIHKKTKSSLESLNNAPKLPPKPVKETCKVVFPYAALNDDELNLAEGQIVTVISKEVEDKGWWKGELDGKIGVFPDNFVKLIVTEENNSSSSLTSKKLSNNKTTPFKRDNSLDNTSSSTTKLKNKISTSNTNLKSSFGKSNPPPLAPSTNKTTDIKKTESLSKLGGGSSSGLGGSTRSNSSSPLKSSFGKSGVKSSSSMSSTESLKSSSSSFLKNKENSSMRSRSREKEIAATAAATVAASKPVPPSPPVSSIRSSLTSSSPPKEFDSVIRRESLNHPTADRVKGPKRRPPSSVFLKDATKSPDSSINTSKDSSTENLSSLPPQSRSSKIVQNIKGVLGGLTNGSDRKSAPPMAVDIKSLEVKKDDKRTSSVSTSEEIITTPSSPNKTLSKSSPNNTQEEETNKKPGWLEELSRKQAHRKSGLFQEKSSDNNKPPPVTSPTTTTPIINNNSANTAIKKDNNKPDIKPEKPSIIGDKPFINNESKPYIPTKPSQIKDEVRKFGKRPTSIESLGGGSDKENNKPPSLTTPVTTTSSSPKDHSNLDSKPPKPVIPSPTTSVLPTPPDPSTKPTTPASPQNFNNKLKTQSQEPKAALSSLKLDINPDSDDLSLLERVRRLERSLLDVHSFYGQQIDELKSCLEQERNDKLKLQDEIQALKNKHQ